jgi:hypothetical protein
MSQCYRFAGQGVGNDFWYEYFACGTDASYQAGNGGQLLYLDGVNLGGGDFVYRNGTTSISVVAEASPTAGFQTYGNCDSCGAVFYDCINGECIPKTTYNTPGHYETLAACQAECGTCENQCNPPNICVPPNHCPDGYVCIGADEFALIKRELS